VKRKVKESKVITVLKYHTMKMYSGVDVHQGVKLYSARRKRCEPPNYV